MRRLFGLKRDVVTVHWRKLYNEEFNGMYFSTDIFPVRWDRACSTYGDGEVYTGFGGET